MCDLGERPVDPLREAQDELRENDRVMRVLRRQRDEAEAEVVLLRAIVKRVEVLAQPLGLEARLPYANGVQRGAHFALHGEWPDQES